MAKGSVRKKGKKWYYCYYVEDASGNLYKVIIKNVHKILNKNVHML